MSFQRFVAFDVETPNRYNNRISAIGISVIENNCIVQDFYTLVNSRTFFDLFNIQLTGITPDSVCTAPDFKKLWKIIEPILSDSVLVAHNALFDLRVLRDCLRSYDIFWKPTVEYFCTFQGGRKILRNIANRKLNTICEYYGIQLDHHHAGSDAQACAKIFLKYLQSGVDIEKYIKNYRICDCL